MSSSGAVPSFVEVGGVRLPADFPVEVRWVTRRLAMGSMIGTVRNMERLRDEGVTHVLDLQEEFDDRTIAGASGIEVLFLPVPNHPAPIPPSRLAEAMRLAPSVLAQEGSRLFVHCLAGRHRAPTFTYAVLRAAGWAADEAAERVLAADSRAQLAAEALEQIDALVRESQTAPTRGGGEP